MSKVYDEIEGFLADAQLEFANAAITELLEKNANDIEALVFNARLLGVPDSLKTQWQILIKL